MNLDEFAAKYGKCKITYKESKKIMLKSDDIIQKGDEVCYKPDIWTKIPNIIAGMVYNEGMARMRRRVTTDS